jgi:hypothetical protein
MKTFEEYLSAIAVQHGSFNVLFESGMYSLLNDLERVVKTLREAGASFEVIGGVAVNAHLLAANERSRTFVTRDIDILVDRKQLDLIARAAEASGYQARKIVGGYMLIRPDQRPGDAVHMVFSGERSKSTQPLVHPEIRPEEREFFELHIPIAPLDDLVQMKLNSFRIKDLVHLQILDECGLISRKVEDSLEPALRERLDKARQQFAKDQPDVDI